MQMSDQLRLPAALHTREFTPPTALIGGCLDPLVCSDSLEKVAFSCLFWVLN